MSLTNIKSQSCTFRFNEINCYNYSFDFTNSFIIEGNIDFCQSYFMKTKIYLELMVLNKGNFDFSRTNFIEGLISFSYVTMKDGHLIFDSAIVDKCFIESIIFSNDIDLQFKSVNSLLINSCVNKQHMRISGVNQFLSFYHTYNLGRIDMNWDKCNVKKSIINQHVLRINKDKTNYKEVYSNASHDFLLLKENYRNIGKYDWEDEAYFNYMKYNTKSMRWFSKKFGKKFFNTIFGAISGYGTRIFNIILSCLIMILISGAIYCNAFYDKVLTFRNVLKSMYFSTITFLTIGYGDFAPRNMNFSDFQTLWTGIEGFAGLLLMSMVTVVIM